MWRPPKRIVYLLPLMATLMFGCRAHTPDAYGIYADTNQGEIVLPGQPVQGAGNFMGAYFGLRGPSGPECRDLQDFIVYKKDVDPDAIRISKLNFLEKGAVSGIFGYQQDISVNLWVPTDQVIDIDVKPVEKHQDMYIVKPRKPLDDGFYALQIGAFHGDIGTEVRVYDVAIGSLSDFPRYEERARRSESEFQTNADDLLAKMNQLLNRRDYQHIQDVYRPGGKILTGNDLQSYATDSQTWLDGAGRILRSKITSVRLIDDNDALCSVVTTYEKAGVQQESMSIHRFGSQYFITDMK